MKNKSRIDTLIIIILLAALLVAVAAIVNAFDLFGGTSNGTPPPAHTQPPSVTPSPEPLPTEPPPPTNPPLMAQGVFDFPSIHIHAAHDPFAVEREFWHDGTISVSGTNEPYLIDHAPVRLRGRGNSTWAHGPEKRPLRLRFDTPRPLLDASHAARDWVLIANLFDPSLVRTHLAFYLGGLLEGIDWSPFSRLVHVYINGEYKGVYQLADERDADAGRADVQFHADPAESGFLIELDGTTATRDRRVTEGEIEGVDFLFVNEWVVDVRFPSRRQRTTHMAYLQEYIEIVDAAMKSHDFAALETLVDIPSLIDYYLTHELFKTIDIRNRSFFMQIRGTGADRRLHFGPPWDFDRSSGNMAFWHTHEDIFAALHHSWFAELFEMPEMYARIAARWHEIKDTHILEMREYAQYLLDNYEAAFERNFATHSHILAGEPDWVRFMSPETRVIETFRGQMEYLIRWLEERAAWLSSYFS